MSIPASYTEISGFEFPEHSFLLTHTLGGSTSRNRYSYSLNKIWNRLFLSIGMPLCCKTLILILSIYILARKFIWVCYMS